MPAYSKNININLIELKQRIDAVINDLDKAYPKFKNKNLKNFDNTVTYKLGNKQNTAKTNNIQRAYNTLCLWSERIQKSPYFHTEEIRLLLDVLQELRIMLDSKHQITLTTIKKHVKKSNVGKLRSSILLLHDSVPYYTASLYNTIDTESNKSSIYDKKKPLLIYTKLNIDNLKSYNKKLILNNHGEIKYHFFTYPGICEPSALIKYKLWVSINNKKDTTPNKRKDTKPQHNQNSDKYINSINLLKLDYFSKSNIILRETRQNIKGYKAILKFKEFGNLSSTLSFQEIIKVITSKVTVSKYYKPYALKFYNYNGDVKTLIVSVINNDTAKNGKYEVIDPEDKLGLLVWNLSEYLKKYCMTAMLEGYYRYTIHGWGCNVVNYDIENRFLGSGFKKLAHNNKPIFSVIFFTGLSIVLTYVYSNALLNLLPLAVAAFFTANSPIILFVVATVLGMIVGLGLWKIFDIACDWIASKGFISKIMEIHNECCNNKYASNDNVIGKQSNISNSSSTLNTLTTTYTESTMLLPNSNNPKPRKLFYYHSTIFTNSNSGHQKHTGKHISLDLKDSIDTNYTHHHQQHTDTHITLDLNDSIDTSNYHPYYTNGTLV